MKRWCARDKKTQRAVKAKMGQFRKLDMPQKHLFGALNIVEHFLYFKSTINIFT